VGWEETFNAISDWIILTDTEGFVIKTNKAGEKFTGLSYPEMVGKLCCQLIHESEESIAKCPMQEMIRTGQSASLEVLLADGKWVAVTVEPLKDKNDNIIATIHIIRDIVPQKRTEETLEYSERKFKSIFKHANDAITYLDSSGKILDVNDKVSEIFGKPKEEIINKHFTKLGIFSAKDIPEYIRLFKSILTGDEQTVTIQIKNTKGKKLFLECSTALIKSDNEPPVIMVISRDVTERIHAEKTLQNRRSICKECVGL